MAFHSFQKDKKKKRETHEIEFVNVVFGGQILEFFVRIRSIEARFLNWDNKKSFKKKKIKKN